MHPGHAGEAAYPGADVALDLCPQGAAGGGQRDCHVDLAVGVHAYGTRHPQLHDVRAQFGVDHGAQDSEYVLYCGERRLDHGFIVWVWRWDTETVVARLRREGMEP